MADGSVVVVGDLMTDVVTRIARGVVADSDTPARISVHQGGTAGNIAAWLVRQQRPARVVARVGDDVFGRAHLAALDDAGVRAEVSIDRTRPTGTVVVLVDDQGRRTMLTDRGANTGLGVEHVSTGLESATHLHLSGYTLLDDATRRAGLAALGACAPPCTVSVSPASIGPLRRVGAAAFLDWTAGSWLCIANLDEARTLAGEGSPAQVAGRLTGHYAEVVVTCGPAGAVWCGAATAPISARARDVDPVDTTGAGDALSAGFLAHRLAGAEPGQALEAGLDLAAQAVGHPGGRPPTRTEPT